MFKRVKVFQEQVKSTIQNNHFPDLFDDGRFCTEWDDFWDHFQTNHSDTIENVNLDFFSGFLVGQYLRGIREPEGFQL